MKQLAVFLDRDGTIIEDNYYLGKSDSWRQELRFAAHAIEGLSELQRMNACLAVISNQAGVARGFFTENRVIEVNREIAARLTARGIHIDQWHYCTLVQTEYARRHNIPLDSPFVNDTSDLRKPGIGMITKVCAGWNTALQDLDLWVIGDKETDAQAGINAGGRGILLSPRAMPGFTCYTDLYQAALHIKDARS